MKRSIYIWFTILGFQINVFGQYLHFNIHPLDRSLVNATYTVLYRSENDALMIGTDKGLYAFDGVHYLLLPRADKGSNHVTAIDHDGSKLWVGYHDGSIFHYDHHKLVEWQIPEGHPNKPITDITFHKDATWISTYGEGVYTYQDKVLYNIDSDDGLPSNDIYSMTINDLGEIHLGTDNGVQVCDFKALKKSVKPYNCHAEASRWIVTDIIQKQQSKPLYLVTQDNEIWEISNVKKPRAILLYKGLSKPNVQAFDDGYIYFDREKNRFQAKKTSDDKPIVLNYKGTQFIDPQVFYLDDENRLWIICKNNGLLSSDIDIRSFESTINDVQHLFVHDKKLYGANEKGLYHITDNGFSKPILEGFHFISHYIDQKSNEIWLGSYNNGIIILDSKTMRLKSKLGTNAGLANLDILSIQKTSDGYWVSTLAGIHLFNNEKKLQKIYAKDRGLPIDYNYTLAADKKDRLLVGTDGHGILVFNKSSKLFEPLVPKGRVTSILPMLDNSIFYIETNHGLVHLSQSDKASNRISQLPTDGVNSVVKDRYDNVLLVLSDAIYTVDLIGNSILPIASDIKNDSSKPHFGAMCYDSTNHTAFGVDNKTIYQIDLRHKSKASPGLHIQHMWLGNKEIFDDNTKVNYDQNDLQIQYYGIWMSNPSELRFQYRLIPSDTNWVSTEDERIIIPNITPGEYEIQIRPTIEGRPFNVSTFTRKISIQAAIWQSNWFWFFFAGIASSLFYLFLVQRNKKQAQLEALKTEKLKVELDVLKSQINPHFLFNSFNTLISIIEQSPEKAVSMVEKLSDFYRNILMHRQDELISLETELRTLEDYIYLLKERFGASIIFEFDIQNPKEFMIIPLTLQLLTENAVKHNNATKTNPLFINIFVRKDRLVIKNNKQLRTQLSPSTHFGLSSLSKRFLAITKNELTINEDIDTFTITIPLMRI